MPIRTVRAVAAALVLVATLWIGVRGVGPAVPPLGQLLDPVHGAWAAATHAALPRSATATIPGLRGPVDVRYDDRGVPHIFATTETDAYRALGYVVARDRLFQLDLQTHAASGRLTEWIGPRALPVDRRVRDLGLTRAAEVNLAAMDSTSMAWKAMHAFADGVNAYVDGLKPAEWPVEYRLLDARPERWKPIDSILLFGRMAWMLSYIPDEAARFAARAQVGDSAADALFPLNSVIQEPIEPARRASPWYLFGPIPPPGRPDTSAQTVASLLRSLGPPGIGGGSDPGHFASNNWAVAPSRSADGHALLANDPHLDLTLPSIWYEAQLVVPGKLDVYGVTIPGAPGIVLGFNRDLAWGFTNTGADVLDFYRETLDNAGHPTRYRLDGQWKPLTLRVEVYRGKHGEVLATDTVRYTHRGPLMHRFGAWVSMRWTALEPSHEIEAFSDAAHATTAREFLDDMARGFFAPAQNMVVADRSGTIAIRSTGRFPIRPKGTNGLEIFDGSTSESDWSGYWPVSEFPQAFDPAQGFLASANQQPEDPSREFAYLGDEHAFEPWRALDINEILRAHDSVTADDMRRFQTDPRSVRARLFLPFFLHAAGVSGEGGDTAPTSPPADASGGDDKASSTTAAAAPSTSSDVAASASAKAAAGILRQWDGLYTHDNGGAALFEEAMRELRNLTWDELADSTGKRVATPTDEIMLELLHQPRNRWWDDRRTKDTVKTRDRIVDEALAAAYDTLTSRLGPAPTGGWPWDRVARVSIRHLLGLRGFSELNLVSDGGIGTLDPAPGNGFGPSWRLVVDLDPAGVKAWDTYPGGQSGNPASPEYADRIPQWLAGKLSPVLFPAGAADLPAARTRATLSLEPTAVEAASRSNNGGSR
jgi:penicillin amidase